MPRGAAVKKRFTEEQIIGVLKKAEAGAKPANCAQAWNLRGDVLQLEGEVRGHDGVRGPATQGAGAREQPAQEAAGRVGAGSRCAEGPAGPKVVSLQARREAVRILAERKLGVTRACGPVGISR